MAKPAGNTSQGKSSVSKWRTHRASHSVDPAASHSADVAAARPADVAAAHPADPAARRPTGYRRRARRRRAHRISPLSASARGRRQQDPGPRQDRRDSFGRDGPDAQDPWPVVSAVDDRRCRTTVCRPPVEDQVDAKAQLLDDRGGVARLGKTGHICRGGRQGPDGAGERPWRGVVRHSESDRRRPTGQLVGKGHPGRRARTSVRPPGQHASASAQAAGVTTAIATACATS